MDYNLDFAGRAACSAEEKEECWKTAELLLEMTAAAARNGMLSLERRIPSLGKPFLEECLKLAMDGMDPYLSAMVMENWILMDGCSGAELLEKCIIREGVLAIQRGENAETVRKALSSLFGFRWANAHVLSFENARINRLAEDLCSRDNYPSRPGQLEKIATALSGESLKTLVRKLDSSVLLQALAGASGEVRNRIFDVMDPQYRKIIVTGLASMNHIDEQAAAEAGRTLIETLGRLIQEGVISDRRVTLVKDRRGSR